MEPAPKYELLSEIDPTPLIRGTARSVEDKKLFPFSNFYGLSCRYRDGGGEKVWQHFILIEFSKGFKAGFLENDGNKAEKFALDVVKKLGGSLWKGLMEKHPAIPGNSLHVFKFTDEKKGGPSERKFRKDLARRKVPRAIYHLCSPDDVNDFPNAVWCYKKDPRKMPKTSP